MGENSVASDRSEKSIAVLDVGKTNKKLLVFNSDLKIVDSVYETFNEYEKNSVRVEAVEETVAWLISSLREIARKHDIGVISITAHGSEFACVDVQGGLTLPVLSYTNYPNPDFFSRFSDKFGDPVAIQRELKTPDMPGLGCIAKGIFFAQEHFPEQFIKTTWILTLPQYYGFALTGNAAVEPTSIASHTALWDFTNNNWSPITAKLGITNMLPTSLSRSWDVLGKLKPEIARATMLPEDTIVSVGIHDSNASLLPYLVKEMKPFVLHSTGTAPNTMCPSDKFDITHEELGKVIFFTLSAFMTPVKTTIFLGGLEFEAYMGMLSKIHDSTPHIPLEKLLLEEILKKRQLFVLPSFVPFGMFPNSKARIMEGNLVIPINELFSGTYPSFFSDYQTAYHAIVLSAALQAEAAIKAAGLVDGMNLFIEGGFSRNDIYTRLIAALFPKVTTLTTNLTEATAFGAALVGKAALLGKTPGSFADLFEIEKQEVISETFDGLDEYRERFLNLVQ